MPKVIGCSQTVVDHEGLVINELSGNVATKDDTCSIGYVTVSEPTSEPWLTLDYDEYICLKKGLMELHYVDDGSEKCLKMKEGDTAFIARGERFRPVFPEGGTEYIPVCIPAFKPERCHREEGNDSAVTKKLLELHEEEETPTPKNDDDKDIIYHMCQKKLWSDAVQSRTAYYPPTFEKDGYFTHATAEPERLIRTANYFYTGTEGDWICLQLSRDALSSIGIITKYEGALPVGQTTASNKRTESKYICPHIYGGIPTTVKGVLTETFPILRHENGLFLKIVGLTE
mmetsp:Transcript_30381/g.34631  ORF Transcript_30381/g.34631 Transcript_30381/m.34631 type:complete len:286 (+) Transcript_30381:109-966(+)